MTMRLPKTRQVLKGLSIVAAFAVVFAVSIPAGAQKFLLDRMRKVYELDKRNGNCRLCHFMIDDKEIHLHLLNDFGRAIRFNPKMQPLFKKRDDERATPKELDVFEDVLRELAYEDSDHDGVYNIEELDLGTYPGDPGSFPEPRDVEKYRRDHPLPLPALIPTKPTPPPPISQPAKVVVPLDQKPSEYVPIEWVIAGAMLAAFAINGWIKGRR